MRTQTLELTVRASALTPATISETDRTVEVIAATGAGVARRDARGPFIERLDMAAFDPQRLIGAPVLNSHKRGDLADILGVVVAAWRDGEKLMARLKIESDALWSRVVAGVVRNVSIGYEVERFTESRDPQSGHRILTAAKWTPREVSFVPVPADAAATTREAVMEEEVIDTPPAEDTNGTPREATDAAIRQLGEALQLERTWADEQIAAGADVEEARAAARAAIRARTTTIRTAGTRDTRSNDDPHVRAERMGEAMFARINPAHQLSEPARAFAHASMVDLARASLRQAGISVSGLSPDTLISRALGTSDFPLALGNFTNRELRAGYEAAPSALRQIARQTTARDFRTKQKVMVETAAPLEKVNERGEFKFGGLVEAAESYRIDTFGKIIAISRQTLVNDDLGWTADLARGFGREAASFEGRFLVTLLESGSGFGPTMSDTEPLFDTAHGNLGSAAALGETPLSAARLAMRKQKTLSGDVLGVGPKWLIVPPDLETAAEKLLASIQATKAEDVNPWSFLSLLVEPRLTSATRYYFAADPAQVEGLEYAYLAGAQGPQTETKTGFEVDGVSVKVRLDYGAGFVDWRGWHMNPGA